MALPFAARITGTGSAFPEGRLTNNDLAKRVETNDEWIRERTGIAERRISDVKNPAERNSGLGAAAAMRALEMAGKTPADVDQIIYGTCTPDTLIPSTACWVQERIGAHKAWAMDLNAACSGFVYGLSVGSLYVQTGQSKVTLVIGTDLLSAFTDWKDRNSCILFGDGAGAAVIEPVPHSSPSQILSVHLGSDGGLGELFYIPAGGSNEEVTEEARASGRNKMQMKGKEIYKEAVRTLTEYSEIALKQHGLSAADVRWVIPHQANLRIIEAVAKRLGVSMDRFVLNIGQFGNTSSATVPTAFDQAVRDGRIQRGDLILMTVFGAGLTYGSALIRW